MSRFSGGEVAMVGIIEFGSPLYWVLYTAVTFQDVR